MNVAFIESFLALYREGNITRASASLGITQQGLSRQVQALEREFGASLFERTRTGVVPTPLGERVRPRLERMCAEYAAALAEARSRPQGEEEPVLRLAFAIGLSNCVDTGFILDYQKAHRDVRIELEEWSQPVCARKLLAGELDLAFLVNLFDGSLFESHALAEDYMFAAIHRDHPLAAESRPMDFALLDGENIITGSPDNALKGLFDHYCALAGISPRVIVSSSHSLGFVNAMGENVGIATVTSAMAARITNPDIVVRRLLAPEPGIMYCCVPRDARPFTERDRLLRHVVDYFASTPMRRFKED